MTDVFGQDSPMERELRDLHAEVKRLRAVGAKTAGEFIAADKRARELEAEVAYHTERADGNWKEIERLREAGGRLRHHVELLLPRDLCGAAREQVIKDLKHWVALAAAQPGEPLCDGSCGEKPYRPHRHGMAGAAQPEEER